MKLSYANKHTFVTYDVVAKVAFEQEFIERRKVITNELKEEHITVNYDESIANDLIHKEIDRLTTVIWNCKNTIRFSQDQEKIVRIETKRMHDSAEKIEFLQNLL